MLSFDRIANAPLTLTQWVVGFLGIVLVRNVIESLASPSVTGKPLDPITLLLHYPLFYLALTLSVCLALASLLREPIAQVLKLVLFGLPLLWLAPLLDLALTGGNGWTTAYLFGGLKQLFVAAGTFFGPFLTQGITPGIRLGVAAGLLATFVVIRRLTGSASRAIFGVVLVYLIVFAFFAAPSILSLVPRPTLDASPGTVSVGIVGDLSQSLVARHWFVGDGTLEAIGVRFSVFMSQAYLILLVPLLLVLFFRLAPSATAAVLKNTRPFRLLHVLVFAAIGAEISAIGGHAFSLSLPTVTSLATLALALASAWLSAVCVNDLHDGTIDRVSNPGRPLVSGAVTRRDLTRAAIISAVFSLLAGLLLGWLPFLGILAFHAFYVAYSAPPLRLKRVFLFGNVLVSAAQFCVFLAAALTVAGALGFADVPWRPIAAIGFLLLFGAPFKDLKDVDGDRREGIPTIPVRLGEKAKITLICLGALSALLPAFLLNHPVLWVAAAGSMLALPFLLRPPFRERRLLALGLGYFVLLAAILPWIV